MATRGHDAPLPITDGDGNKRQLSPLGFNDYAILAQQIRAARLEAMRDYLTGLDQRERVEQVHMLMAEPIGIPAILAECETPQGALSILHLSLKKTDPDLTIEQVNESFGKKNLMEALDFVIELSGLAVGEETTEDADPPSPTGMQSSASWPSTTEKETTTSESGQSPKS